MEKKKGISLNLSKFDLSIIKDDSVVVLIGKRNTGKSKPGRRVGKSITS